MSIKQGAILHFFRLFTKEYIGVRLAKQNRRLFGLFIVFFNYQALHANN